MCQNNRLVHGADSVDFKYHFCTTKRIAIHGRSLGVERVGVLRLAPHRPNAVICVVHTIILTLNPPSSTPAPHHPRRLDPSGHPAIGWSVLRTCRLMQFPLADEVDWAICGDCSSLVTMSRLNNNDRGQECLNSLLGGDGGGQERVGLVSGW
ncbi:hypothetical protein BD410DRAFT_805999 [Rickenella mellea]|uniref:Uncharacterized protein n=1 Tax=Rickenella mellea TaxID=50990 RepID=A0A4Y7PVS3_9AGAM|nr:hypothetical protein BD410DRAFT_805999 [Rickenella mellea]